MPYRKSARRSLCLLDKLVLFHSGTIAATISFAGLLHQASRPAIQWKYCLFASWAVLFMAMVSALARNWYGQNAWFHTTAGVWEKHESELSKAYGAAVTQGGPIVDRKTGKLMDGSKVRTGAADVARLCKIRSKENEKKAARADELRLLLKTITFAATGIGVILALIFAMQNLS